MFRVFNSDKATFTYNYNNDEIIIEGKEVDSLNIKAENIPYGLVIYPYMQVTDFKSWSEFVDVFLPLFQVDKLSQELMEKIEEFRKIRSLKEKLTKAILFVQNEIRYYGHHEGIHSHTPHSPSQTFKNKFGDCKDKTLLLVTILKNLGFKADPMLVDSYTKKYVALELPTTFAFDHAITYIKFEGKDYFIDATQIVGNNPLDYPNPDYGHGLVINKSTVDFTKIPLTISSEPKEEIKETFTINDENDTACLEVTKVYKSDKAVNIRNTISALGREKYQEELRNFYKQYYDRVESLSAIEIDDDVENDILKIQEKYQVKLRRDSHSISFRAWSISRYLSELKDDNSPYPFAVPANIHAKHVIKLNDRLPDLSEYENITIDSDEFNFSRQNSVDEENLSTEITYSLQTLKDECEDNKIYFENLKIVNSSLGLEMTSSTERGRSASSAFPFSNLKGILIFIIAAVWAKLSLKGKKDE